MSGIIKIDYTSDFDTLSCVRLSKSSLGVMQTYLTSTTAACGGTSKMDGLCAMRPSLVAMFPHVEAPPDDGELSLSTTLSIIM